MKYKQSIFSSKRALARRPFCRLTPLGSSLADGDEKEGRHEKSALFY